MKKAAHLIIITICVAFLGIFQLQAQEKVFKGDPDEAFKKARELAFNNQRKQAQDTLLLILTKYPDYLDIRSFLASTYSWDGNYKQARKLFEAILTKDPKRKQDWVAAANNDLWSSSALRAKQTVEQGLSHFPDDLALRVLLAKAEEDNRYYAAANSIVEKILKEHPSHEEALAIQKRINDTLRKNSIGLSYSLDVYKNNDRDVMHYGAVTYRRQATLGTFIARINYNRRFQTNGLQYEIDLYPRIANGLYAYVSYGVSDASIFPSSRYGAELFGSLGGGFELSLGMRSLTFEETTTIYTGSLGWYTGNDYWAFRPYITPGDGGTSKSGTLIFRKYRSDADNYLGLSVGMGFSPTLDRFPVSNNLQAFFNLKSQKFRGEYFFTSKDKKYAWGSFINLTREEKSFARGSYFVFYSLGFSLDVRFK